MDYIFINMYCPSLPLVNFLLESILSPKAQATGVSNPSAAKNTAIYRPHVLTTGKWRAGAEEKLQPFPS